MAVKGNYTAYRQLSPLSGDVSDDIRNAEDQQFRHRAEDRIIAAQKKADQDAEEKKKQDLRDKFVKNLKNYDTGSQSLNELQGRLIQRATNEYIPIMEILSNPKSTDEEKLKAQIKAQNIDNLPENLKLVTDFYTNQDRAYREAVAKGSIFPNPDYEKKFNKGFENYLLELDDQGLPMVAFKDTNNDGVVDVKDIQTYERIKSGLPTFDFQPMFNLDAIASETAKRLGTVDITTDTGYNSVQTKEVKKDDLEKVSRNLFLDANGQATKVAMSELRKRGLSNTPENIEKIRRDFITKTLSETDYLKKEDFDYGARNADANSAETRKQNAIKNAKEKTTTPEIGEPVKPTRETWAMHFKDIDTKTTKSVPVKGKVVLPAIPLGKGRTITNGVIQNYTYDKNGNLVVDISYETSKTTNLENIDLENMSAEEKVKLGVKNEKEQIRVTKENESKVAGALGLTVEQLRDSAKVKGVSEAARYGI